MTRRTVLAPRGLNVLHADELARSLAEANVFGESVLLDLSACRHIDPGAGYVVGNALRPFNSAERLWVRVPLYEISGHEWFRVFTRSGLGRAISRYGSRIEQGDKEIGSLLKQQYPSGPIAATNLLSMPDLHLGVFAPDSIDAFSLEFRRALRSAGFDIGGMTSDSLESITRLCFEAIQNVVDLARGRPFPADDPTNSTFASAYYRWTATAPDVPGNRRRYFANLWNSLEVTAQELPFLALTIADDGVGVAARQSQKVAIYDGDFEAELSALRAALLSGTSIKLVAHDATVRGDPGFGYDHIRDCIQSLSGLLTLRTGRSLAVLDGTSPSAEFAFYPQSLPFVPGTILEILVPSPSPQYRLEV